MIKKIALIVTTLSTSMLFTMPTWALSKENIPLQEIMTNPEMQSDSLIKQAVETTIKLSIQKIKNIDNKKLVQIKLTSTEDGNPITLSALKEVHTQKIHLLIIDDSLQDYTHVHPTATNIPGVYQFEWQPKKQANYRVFADLFPLNTNTQEYAVADLIRVSDVKPKVNRTESFQSVVDDFIFKLSLDNKKLQAGKASMASINVTDQKGVPVKNLEPIMGTFAHIVGFSEDLKNVIHIHPMGKEPSKISDRGGPEFEFHIEPESAGFIKLFAQVKINGKELYVPFGMMIQP
jgi:hypothetical protein